ncbi:MAG TPA: ATPase domain-containing protein [Methanoregula sp.]|nr:ATPase domain-containing protein [Methanoregula sp.]
MQDNDNRKMPTGISSLDPILEGGVPPGSVILLFGDLGGGNYEFAYSSLVNILPLMEEAAPAGLLIPREIRYITFTRLKEDVRREILSSFRREGLERMIDTVRFDDLSERYFDKSVVPDDWYSPSDIISRMEKRSEYKNILSVLFDVMNNAQDDSLIIVDSITDVATQHDIPNLWSDLTGFLRGFQRIAKKKNITIYLLLSKGVLGAARELELADIADAVLLFKWEESTGARRQRVMYFEKFRGVMPHLEERDLVKFAVRITTAGGFEVSNIRVII